MISSHLRTSGEELSGGHNVIRGSVEEGSRLPFHIVVTGTAGDEHDVKVPLLGDGRIEPLTPADTESLVEAAEEAVRAESANSIEFRGRNPFSTRHVA
jgi:hypothetical protein